MNDKNSDIRCKVISDVFNWLIPTEYDRYKYVNSITADFENDEPCIVHFTGHKPWLSDANINMYEDYYKYKKEWSEFVNSISNW